ncbi:MAG: hypothetical protein JNJ54_35010 [Myxococcaceae bacterium]|nr:hypothetical protein [Myxococcaceae bacterium]
MPMLMVNKVPLPVLIDSVTVTEEVVGSTMRGANGFLQRDRRGTKATISFALAPRSLDEAMLYRALITGEGEYWSMVSDTYGSKGLRASSNLGWYSGMVSNVNPLTEFDPDAAIFADPGGGIENLVIPNIRPRQQTAVSGYASNPGIDGVTLIGFRTIGGSANARLFGWSWRSAVGTPDVSRERLGAPPSAGAAQAYTGNEVSRTFTGSELIIQPGTVETSYSVLFLIPRFFQQAQVDTLLGAWNDGGFRAPHLPRVLVETDLLPGSLSAAANGVRSFIALGECTTINPMPHHRDGAWDPSAVSIECELVEV